MKSELKKAFFIFNEFKDYNEYILAGSKYFAVSLPTACVPPVSWWRTPRGTRTPGWEPLN